MTDILQFGDIVRYNREEYVYLAATAEIIYLAKILNTSESSLVLAHFERICGKGSSRQLIKLSHPVYCFVELQTAEFQARLAHMYNNAHDFHKDTATTIIDKLAHLDGKDVAEIKNVILEKNSPVSRELRELIQQLV